ncbi:MAG: IS630 family transposase [Lachnospiraceae bacterium]|nr:IS630 family transposase [Lachnospiraceae bacterium]
MWITNGIPKLNDAAFVDNMEEVLTIYEMPYYPEIPVICMDEKSVQLLGEIRERIQAKSSHISPDTQLPQPGCCERIDSEYSRCGAASIFMFTEPLGRWRHVLAKAHRNRGDFAQMMLSIAEKYCPDVKRIILVADNLNSHSRTLFYEAFKPSIACWLSPKYEFHCTSKHGSWLNMAETELSSLSLQCLGNQRIKDVEHLNELLSSWEISRNRKQKGIIWHFKTADARAKLYRLYPKPLFND